MKRLPTCGAQWNGVSGLMPGPCLQSQSPAVVRETIVDGLDRNMESIASVSFDCLEDVILEDNYFTVWILNPCDAKRCRAASISFGSM